MRSVNVKFLRPGQVIADVVKNANGAVLCPIGYTLTEQAIQRLKNADVTAVYIEGSSTPNIDIEARLTDLESRFASVDDPILLEIKSLLETRYNLLKEEYGG